MTDEPDEERYLLLSALRAAPITPPARPARPPGGSPVPAAGEIIEGRAGSPDPDPLLRVVFRGRVGEAPAAVIEKMRPPPGDPETVRRRFASGEMLFVTTRSGLDLVVSPLSWQVLADWPEAPEAEWEQVNVGWQVGSALWYLYETCQDWVGVEGLVGRLVEIHLPSPKTGPRVRGRLISAGPDGCVLESRTGTRRTLPPLGKYVCLSDLPDDWPKYDVLGDGLIKPAELRAASRDFWEHGRLPGP